MAVFIALAPFFGAIEPVVLLVVFAVAVTVAASRLLARAAGRLALPAAYWSIR